MTVMRLDGPIYQAKLDLTEQIPLHVYLVKGSHYAVWIDSGVKAMFPLLQETMARAGVADGALRFVLHTHSHHDHIGCNAQLKKKTGCLVAASEHYAHWHADFERHYEEFARPLPHLVPDTEKLREAVFGILDAPHPVDLSVDEGAQFHLGGGVSLQAFRFPGHMLAELGWFEPSTRTFILGDAVTGLDWPFFHSHLSVQGYRDSLTKLGSLMGDLAAERVLLAHFPPMTSEEVEGVLEQAAAYIDEVEATLIRILAGHERVTLEELWTQTCVRMAREKDFRALNMVFAHVQDLLARRFIREVDSETYDLR
jgi:glyoxylase-like metal-dependent hydrolase (beta-lactamase superfamily II)